MRTLHINHPRFGTAFVTTGDGQRISNISSVELCLGYKDSELSVRFFTEVYPQGHVEVTLEDPNVEVVLNLPDEIFDLILRVPEDEG